MHSRFETIKKIVSWSFLIIVFVLANFFIWRNTGTSETLAEVKNNVDELFSRGQYHTIIDEYQWDDLNENARISYLIAHAKVGKYDSAMDYLGTQFIDSRTLDQLYKMLSFYDNQDWQLLIDYLAGANHTIKSMRSLNLQMRAEAYQKINQLDEALTLAQDAFDADQFAPAPLKTAGIIHAKNREWTEADQYFQRAVTMDVAPDDDFWYYKGLTAFYLGQRDIMLESFENISEESEYQYNVALFSGRHRFERDEYDQALLAWQRNETLDSTNWVHQMRIGKLYAEQEDRNRALDAQYLALDRAGSTPHPELLSDMIVPLVETGDEAQRKIIETLLKDRLGTSQWHYELYIRALQRSRLYERALEEGNNALDVLEDVQDANLETIHNFNMRSLIHLLLKTKGTEQEQQWLEEMIAYQGATIKDQFVYIALWDYGMGDIESATRALQEITSDVQERDLKTIRILHFIYDKQPRDALRYLTNYSSDKDYDIDFQWLKWKVLSLLQDGAEAYRQETLQQLQVLNQVGNDEEEIELAFERRFAKWIQYMKHFYH